MLTDSGLRSSSPGIFQGHEKDLRQTWCPSHFGWYVFSRLSLFKPLGNIGSEVMSGMGRTGTLHAWQQEGVTPDIQTLAKGLGGGYAPIAAMLINHRVADTLQHGTG